MTYEAQISLSKKNPGCILFLLDQSGSMSHHFAGENISKAQGAADAINRLIHELILKCTKEDGLRDYFDIAIIGYGASKDYAGPLVGQKFVKLSWLADNTRKLEERTKTKSDGAGGLVQEKVKFPIWFDAIASGDTPMFKALKIAYDLISEWVASHPTSFPPIVFNITDGGATDADPESIAKQIMELSTNDGKALLFNCHISEIAGNQIVFPSSESELPPDELARKLFRMSSTLPSKIQKAAETEGLNAKPDSRGFAFNSDLVQLIKFLDVGTRFE